MVHRWSEARLGTSTKASSPLSMRLLLFLLLLLLLLLLFYCLLQTIGQVRCYNKLILLEGAPGANRVCIVIDLPDPSLTLTLTLTLNLNPNLT